MGLSPDTASPMVPLVIDGVTVEVCKQTGGIWFGEGALAAIRLGGPGELKKLDDQTAVTQPAAVQPDRPHRCPDDGASLLHYHYLGTSPVVLEQCMQCGGIWAAHTELDKMVALASAAPATAALHQVNYPLDKNGEYDDTPVTPLRQNVSPEVLAAVAQLDAERDETVARYNAFSLFLKWINWDPFRVYIGQGRYPT
ncbi:MAG: zf-TFIIB domain-containing protein [Fimbriimonas ginsengisoli]|uniref:Zf-TFIIB domain-containing protein n=1 Tax=Fimbriimonas ginsengisoli TaxID=1005039 RepID=A0A931LRF2_FIMGI|nr:zf-TFIIB domain-containing protein [Fimbriimonas ginsengisoli]